MKVRRGIAMLAVLSGAAFVSAQHVAAQSVRSLINGGNDQYAEQRYTDAEVAYRKALEKERGSVQGHFNLGDALHKQGKYDEAVKEYENAVGKSEQKSTRAFANYNIGNSYLKEQRYQEAVQSYIESLKLNPNDEDTRYNLSYALEKLRQQQQQQQNKNQDKNKDKNDKQKQDQPKNQNKQQDKNQQQQQQQHASQQQKRMSKEEADRILEVLKNNEKDVQKKLRVRQAVRPRTDKDW